MKHIYLPGSFRGGAIGAIALCGHVKATPWSGARWTGEQGPEWCRECLSETEEKAA